MIKKFRLWLLTMWRWYRRRSLYVVADATDNSVTLSRNLCDLLDLLNQEEAKVFVFSLCNYCANDVSHGTLYAFALNPNIGQPTQLADIQYNTKYHTVGFESLCPTVNRIFYDYGLPSSATKAKFTVEPVTTPYDKKFYVIMPPKQ